MIMWHWPDAGVMAFIGLVALIGLIYWVADWLLGRDDRRDDQ